MKTDKKTSQLSRLLHARSLIPILCFSIIFPFTVVAIEPPTDPFFNSQEQQNQWALERIGLDNSSDSGWRLVPNDSPVVIAVIDSGLDWNHLDMAWENIWHNPLEIPDNGLDDDNNG